MSPRVEGPRIASCTTAERLRRSRTTRISGKVLRVVASSNALREYLAVGCAVAPPAARAYLQQLLDSSPGDADRPVDILCRIVEEATVQRGHADVVIPLSGGYDSRGLLAVALEILPARNISCITFGTEESHDVMVAARVCARVNVRHERLDPNTVVWDLDRFTAIGRALWERWRSLARIDSIAIYQALADRIGDRPVLSGYLGDPISGKRIPHDAAARFGAGAVAAFLARNQVTRLADPVDTERLETAIATFIGEHEQEDALVASWPGLTDYDLLDIGFRQAGRIRAAVSGTYGLSITPYADPRWVGYWMSRPLSERVRQAAYRQLYREHFPRLFAEPPASGLARWKRRVPVNIKRRLRRQPKQVDWVRSYFQRRGDPRRNHSMAAVLCDATDAFDRREMTPEVSTRAAFANVAEGQGTSDDVSVLRLAASAEMYLRAGVLHAPA